MPLTSHFIVHKNPGIEGTVERKEKKLRGMINESQGEAGT